MKKIFKFIKKNILVVLLLIVNGTVLANNKILSNQVSYTNSKTQQTTVEGSLDELFSAVDINNRLGSTDISGIANGTITGAISQIKGETDTLNNNLAIASEFARSMDVNIYSDITSLTMQTDINQYALDFVKTLYSILNEVGAWKKVVRTYDVKQYTKDGQTKLSSGRGWLEFYSNNSYSASVSNITAARMTCIFYSYGTFPTYVIIWGNRVQYLRFADGEWLYGSAYYTVDDI